MDKLSVKEYEDPFEEKEIKEEKKEKGKKKERKKSPLRQARVKSGSLNEEKAAP